MALNVNIIGRDSEGNLQALKVNSEGNLDFGQLETEIQAVKDNQGRLYGKYGEIWIPIKVDSEGRPIISSDVTVNAEGLVVDLGQIKQGPAGTEPWPVQLSGAYVELGKVPAVSLASSESLIILEEGFYNVKEVSVGFTTGDARTLQLYIRYGTRDPGQTASLKSSELLYDNKDEPASTKANFVANFPIKHPYFRLHITNTHQNGTVIWTNGRIMGRVV